MKCDVCNEKIKNTLAAGLTIPGGQIMCKRCQVKTGHMPSSNTRG